jgi:hypothetical protein
MILSMLHAESLLRRAHKNNTKKHLVSPPYNQLLRRDLLYRLVLNTSEKHVSRQTVCRILSDKGNPRWDRIDPLIDAVGLQVQLTSKSPCPHRRSASPLNAVSLQRILMITDCKAM